MTFFLNIHYLNNWLFEATQLQAQMTPEIKRGRNWVQRNPDPISTTAFLFFCTTNRQAKVSGFPTTSRWRRECIRLVQASLQHISVESKMIYPLPAVKHQTQQVLTIKVVVIQMAAMQKITDWRARQVNKMYGHSRWIYKNVSSCSAASHICFDGIIWSNDLQTKSLHLSGCHRDKDKHG